MLSLVGVAVLLLPTLPASRLDDAWDHFNLEGSDEHMIHEHFVDWMFGNVDAGSSEFYFQSHDVDRDSRLDGLELLHALHHQNSSVHASSSQEHWHEDSLVIDLLLRQADANDDGFLDYSEYVLSRKRYTAV